VLRKGRVDALTFSADGKRLAAVVDSRLAIIADAKSGKQIAAVAGRGYSILAAGFTDEGKALTTAGGEVVLLWDADRGLALRSVLIPPNVDAPQALSLGGRLLACATPKEGSVLLVLDAANGREVFRAARAPDDRRGLPLTRVFLSRDGATLAAWEPAGQTVLLWQVATGKGPRSLEGPQRDLAAAAFSADGRMFAAADRETITVWETAAGRPRRRLKAPSPVRSLAFSPDGRYLLSGGEGKGGGAGTSLRLWDLHTKDAVHQFPGHPAGTLAVAYSPDGKRVAAAGRGEPALVWDVSEQQARKRPDPGKLAAKELDTIWAALGDADPAKAYDAVCTLTALPDETAMLVRSRVLADLDRVAKQLALLVADLDNPRFAVREKATTALRRWGESAEPALRHALKSPSSDETRRRLEAVLAGLHKGEVPQLSRGQLHAARAIEALEHARTPAAREALRSLAGVLAEPWLVQEARAALDRLDKRGP
jgi:WD40 repeat protein